jgi:hypothetical protein
LSNDHQDLKSLDHSSLVIDRELRELPEQPIGNPILRRPILPAKGPARRWRLDRSESLLTAGGMAFLCVMFFVLMQFIHPAPDKLTVRQDSAELTRLEAQTQADKVRTAVQAPVAASNVEVGRASSKPKGHSQSKSRQSGLIARRARSVDQRSDLASSGANEESEALKSYSQRQTDRDLQRQQAMASSRQRYAEQGSNSLLGAIRRALGFSTQ